MRCVAKANAQFLNELRFAETGLTYDEHQLAITVARPFPAAHQHGDFFVTTDEGRLMALARSTSTTACPYKSKQQDRLWQALQFMGAALLGDEKTSNLALHPRRHHDRAWLCERLNPRRSVRRITVNLARRIYDDGASFDTDACVKRWFARTAILAVDVSERALDR